MARPSGGNFSTAPTVQRYPSVTASMEIPSRSQFLRSPGWRSRSNRPARKGMMVIDKTKDAMTEKITDTPSMPINSPAAPGINAIGAKASAVVSVEAKSGPNSFDSAMSMDSTIP